MHKGCVGAQTVVLSVAARRRSVGDAEPRPSLELGRRPLDPYVRLTLSKARVSKG